MSTYRHSLGIRHLVCGSCNGCEHEMNALNNAYYDITREGWDIVASPRHADVVTVTGPMTEAMRVAALATLQAVPQPVWVHGRPLPRVAVRASSWALESSCAAVRLPLTRFVPGSRRPPRCSKRGAREELVHRAAVRVD